MHIIERLDEARRATDVLEHPFYTRWTAGELTADELARYAGEYRHAVVALAETSRLAAVSAPDSAAAGLLAHAEEERGHISVWDGFAQAARERAGATGEPTPAREPLPTTRACAEAWTAGETVLEHLAVLYVLEASQPEIARTKLEGLTEHYGYTPEGPATAYFSEHESRDVEHAGEARELIEELLASCADPQGDAERMVGRAQAALRGNWTLLDGVQELAPAAA